MKTETKHAGKGDTPRKVDGEAYRQNYDAIFKKREALACKGGNYTQEQEAEFYQAHGELRKLANAFCHQCGDGDCAADPDHDSHDENLYKEDL